MCTCVCVYEWAYAYWSRGFTFIWHILNLYMFSHCSRFYYLFFTSTVFSSPCTFILCWLALTHRIPLYKNTHITRTYIYIIFMSKSTNKWTNKIRLLLRKYLRVTHIVRRCEHWSIKSKYCHTHKYRIQTNFNIGKCYY